MEKLISDYEIFLKNSGYDKYEQYFLLELAKWAADEVSKKIKEDKPK